MRRAILLSLTLLLSGVGQAKAGTILYYADLTLGTDRMAGALTGLVGTHTTTTATSLGDFTTKIASGNYDLGILFQQNSSGAAYDAAFAALGAHISGGGLAIAADWTQNGTHAGHFQAGYTGSNNQNLLTVLDPALTTGLTNPVSLTNPGWGVFSLGLSLSGGTTAAEFANLQAAIVGGNGGRTYFNGFFNDTFAVGADGVQLFTNEINAVFASVAPPSSVPEPASLALLGMAIPAFAGVARRRRKQSAEA